VGGFGKRTRLMKRRMKAFAHALDVNIPRGQFLAYSMPDPWLDLSKPETSADD